MAKTLAVLSTIVLFLLVTGGTAWADSIPIANASFETTSGPLFVSCGTACAFNGGPIPGWSGYSAGSWEPGSYFSAIPNGNLVAYMDDGGYLSQTLSGTSVQANSIYTLSVFVGNRTDQINGFYTLSLDTILGGVTTTLCSYTGDAADPNPAYGGVAAGTFHVESCSYTSGSNVPAGNLFIQFKADSGQLDIDEVTLTDPPATTIPEPNSLLLLGMGALLVLFVSMSRRTTKLSVNA